MIAVSATPSRAFAIWWKDLSRWSVGSFRIPPWKWPREQIKKLALALERRREPVDRDVFTLHPQYFVSLRFTGEVEQRDLHGKTTFKGGLFFAHPGDIIYSKIDVRNGAIGIVPDQFPVVVVTSEFPVYRINRKVAVSEYIQLVFRTEHFRNIVNSMVSGTSGRKRVQPDDLENVEIPLPSLTEQQAIVEYWRSAEDRISTIRAQVGRRIKEVEDRFLEELGLNRFKIGDRGKAFAIYWKDLERWGISFNRQDRTALDPAVGKFPVVRLADIVADLENGWSPQCLDRPAEPDEWGVLKLGAVSFGTYDENENKALPPALSPKPELEVKPGQVLISRANITRLVGACALVERSRPRLMLCDKIFRVVPRKQSLIELAYMAEVMKIPQVRSQIESAATGTSATMQNITKPSLLALRLPLPPIATQREMVARSAAGRAEVARELTSAESLTTAINTEIEAIILGTRTLKELRRG